MTVKIREKGQVTIPAHVRRAAHLEEGDPVEVEFRHGCIVLVPVRNGTGAEAAADESWLTPEWEERINASLAEVEAGLGRVFESDDDFLSSFDDTE